MSPKTDIKDKEARCALCGGKAPAVVEGVRWDVCPACTAGLPPTFQADLVARRRRARVAWRVVIAVVLVLTPIFLVLAMTGGLTYFELFCVFLIAGSAGVVLDRARQRLRDAVHGAALATITSRATPVTT